MFEVVSGKDDGTYYDEHEKRNKKKEVPWQERLRASRNRLVEYLDNGGGEVGAAIKVQSMPGEGVSRHGRLVSTEDGDSYHFGSPIDIKFFVEPPSCYPTMPVVYAALGGNMFDPKMFRNALPDRATTLTGNGTLLAYTKALYEKYPDLVFYNPSRTEIYLAQEIGASVSFFGDEAWKEAHMIEAKSLKIPVVVDLDDKILCLPAESTEHPPDGYDWVRLRPAPHGLDLMYKFPRSDIRPESVSTSFTRKNETRIDLLWAPSDYVYPVTAVDRWLGLDRLSFWVQSSFPLGLPTPDEEITYAPRYLSQLPPYRTLENGDVVSELDGVTYDVRAEGTYFSRRLRFTDYVWAPLLMMGSIMVDFDTCELVATTIPIVTHDYVLMPLPKDIILPQNGTCVAVSLQPYDDWESQVYEGFEWWVGEVPRFQGSDNRYFVNIEGLAVVFGTWDIYHLHHLKLIRSLHGVAPPFVPAVVELPVSLYGLTTLSEVCHEFGVPGSYARMLVRNSPFLLGPRHQVGNVSDEQCIYHISSKKFPVSESVSLRLWQLIKQYQVVKFKACGNFLDDMVSVFYSNSIYWMVSPWPPDYLFTVYNPFASRSQVKWVTF